MQVQSLPLVSPNNSITAREIREPPKRSPQLQTNSSSASSVPIIASSLPQLTTTTERSPSPIDLNHITGQVERRLMRKLVIESERRGKIR